MPAREYAEWRAYEQVSGPLDLRDRLDVVAGVIAERITNMLRSGGKVATAGDFVPKWAEGKRELITDGDDPESPGQTRGRG